MRFFFGILCGLAVTAGAYFLAYWYSPFRSTSSEVYTIKRLYECKEGCLSTSPAPRIILLSGSNGLYGVGMKEIEQATGWRAVNCATVGLISLDYHFYHARKFLKPGDVVILAFEYHYYGSPGDNPTNSAAVLQRDRGYFLQLPIWEKLQWVYGEPFPAFIEKVWEPPGRAREIERKSEAEFLGNINPQGDYTGHRKPAKTPAQAENVLSSGAIDVAKIAVDKNSSQSWALISQFAKWCRENGVTLLATFPSTVYFPDYETPAAAAGFQHIVDQYRALGIPMLGSPKDFIWDQADFFDTNYHLVEEAKLRRTALLVTCLRPYLQKQGRASEK